jgi:hypothetical protein
MKVTNFRFDLTTNAFAVLEVSLRASEKVILKAFDGLSFEDGIDRHELEKARAALLSPRDRVKEEAAWLPEITPTKARSVVEALKSGTNDLAKFGKQLPNLAGLNFQANVLFRNPENCDLACSLISRVEKLDYAALQNVVNESRVAAGLPASNFELLQSAISEQLVEYANLTARTLANSSDGVALITQLMETFDPEQANAEFIVFIDAVITQFSAATERQLDGWEVEIEELVSSARANPSDEKGIREITVLVSNWDRLRQPVQLRDEQRGFDDPKSKELCNQVRDVCLYLANDCKEFFNARMLARCLAEHFGELPSIAELLESDLTKLDDLVAEQRDEEILAPMIGIIDSAKSNLNRFALDVTRSNLANGGYGQAGELVTAFVAANKQPLISPAITWWMVRQLAISLHNDSNSPEAAATIIDWLLNLSPPGDVQEQLLIDKSTVSSVIRANEFADAMKTGDLKRADELAQNLTAQDVGGQDALAMIKGNIQQRISEKNRSRWTWGIIVAVGIVWAFLANSNDSSDGYSTDDYADSATEVAALPDYDVGEPTGDIEEFDQTEEPPPLYSAGALSRAQLRWCKFESARLDEIGSRVANNVVNSFNSSADNFNSRCNGAQYRSVDGSAIDLEVSNSQTRIISEANARLAEWEQENERAAPIPNPTKPDQSNSYFDPTISDQLDDSIGDGLMAEPDSGEFGETGDE